MLLKFDYSSIASPYSWKPDMCACACVNVFCASVCSCLHTTEDRTVRQRPKWPRKKKITALAFTPTPDTNFLVMLTFPAPHDDPCMCLCAFWDGPRGICVHVSGGSQWGEGDQGEGVTVAWWTIAREQYVGQGLALASLSWLEPWLGVLNFCMHDQWHWIKKREKDSGMGEGKEWVRHVRKETD